MTGAPALTIAALGLGVAYTLSPLTLWLTLLVAAAVVARLTALGSRERRLLAGIIAAAIAVRVLAIEWLILTTEPGVTSYPSFFGDGSYAIGRSLWLRMVWLGEPMHPRHFLEVTDPYGDTGYHNVQAAVQVLVGPAPWALHLLTAAIFVGGAIVCFSLVRAAYGRPAGAFVLATLLFWPGWLAWSVTPIKDAMQFTLTAAVIACTLYVLHARSLAFRTLAALAAAVAIALLSTLRSGTLAVTIATLAAAAAVMVLQRYRARAVFAGVPALAIVLAVAPWSQIEPRISAEVTAAANRHLGHVRTPGLFYKALDEHLYVNPGIASLTWDEAVRFLTRSVAAFFMVPLPWQLGTTRSLALLPAQLFWYVLLALAAAGLPTAFRRAPALTAMLVAYVAISAAVIAPNSGNVGTLMRHRDGVLPFVVCLSGAGLAAVLSRRSLRAGTSGRVLAREVSA
jgi:hypothetical protein